VQITFFIREERVKNAIMGDPKRELKSATMGDPQRVRKHEG
jgi:hypothetical protein